MDIVDRLYDIKINPKYPPVEVGWSAHFASEEEVQVMYAYVAERLGIRTVFDEWGWL